MVTVSQALEKVSCFDKSDEDASKILNETLSREEYYLNEKRRVALQSRFDALSERLNDLKLFGAEIKSMFIDDKIDDYISDIDNSSKKYYYDMAGGYYDFAASDLAAIEEKIDTLEAYLNVSNLSYSKLKGALDAASQKLETVNLIIQKDSPIYDEISKMNLSIGKIRYEDVDTKVNEINSISQRLDEIIEKEKSTEATRAPSFFAGIAKSISIPIIESIADPLGIKEEEKKYWISGIPLLVMLVADVIILAILFIAFFFIVLKKQNVFMKGKVLQTWAVIFGVVIVLLLGVTFAINSLISKETGEVPLISFVHEIKKADTIYILPEYLSGMNETYVKECAEKIGTVLEAVNKSVNVSDVVDGVCMETTVNECLKRINAPVIIMKYAQNNSASFYTFYKTEAEIKGTNDYFKKCAISKVIDELIK
jgi:ABC-type multidrug transport system fused ATPase/permease subunit